MITGIENQICTIGNKMIKLNGKPINITHFPDRTTQVWKLDFSDGYNIEWDYENDAEIFHLAQLLDLCCEQAEWETGSVKLFMPYFPYARQDKEVRNDQTFALTTLMGILWDFFPCLQITTVDIHSNAAYNMANSAVNEWKYENFWIDDREPEEHEKPFINTYPKSLLEIVSNYDVLIFPDEGAKNRYSKLFDNKKYSLTKVRNQQTGEIAHMEFDTLVDISGSVAVVDDICDGGRTFMGVAKAMAGFKYDKFDLVVTHGIFSNAGQLECMVNDCFDKVITTDSLYRDLSWYEACQQDYKCKTINRYFNEGKMQMVSCSPGVDFEF